jgi:Uma2 family endonuclease
MSALDPRVSFAELETWPDFGGDVRYELYEGEVIELPAAFVGHQYVAMHVVKLLSAYQAKHGGLLLFSPVDVVLSQYDVFQPDVLWVGKNKMHLVRRDRPIEFVPDLAVEVISRSTGVRDRGRKKEIFGKHGLPEYWLVEPHAESLEIYTHDSGRLDLVGYYARRDEVNSPTLPDLRFSVDTLFTNPLSR